MARIASPRRDSARSARLATSLRSGNQLAELEIAGGLDAQANLSETSRHQQFAAERAGLLPGLCVKRIAPLLRALLDRLKEREPLGRRSIARRV